MLFHFEAQSIEGEKVKEEVRTSSASAEARSQVTDFADSGTRANSLSPYEAHPKHGERDKGGVVSVE